MFAVQCNGPKVIAYSLDNVPQSDSMFTLCSRLLAARNSLRSGSAVHQLLS